VLTDAPVTPRADFDLAAEWQRIADDVNELRRTVHARLRVRLEHLTPLRHQFGDDLEIGDALPDGRFDVVVSGTGVMMLAQQLAGWGTTIDVVGPVALQRDLVRIGHELVSRDEAGA
jgi:WYL domain